MKDPNEIEQASRCEKTTKFLKNWLSLVMSFISSTSAISSFFLTSGSQATRAILTTGGLAIDASMSLELLLPTEKNLRTQRECTKLYKVYKILLAIEATATVGYLLTDIFAAEESSSSSETEDSWQAHTYVFIGASAAGVFKNLVNIPIKNIKLKLEQIGGAVAADRIRDIPQIDEALEGGAANADKIRDLAHLDDLLVNEDSEEGTEDADEPLDFRNHSEGSSKEDDSEVESKTPRAHRPS